MKVTLLKTHTGYQIQFGSSVGWVSTEEANRLKESAQKVRLVVSRGVIRGMEWTLKDCAVSSNGDIRSHARCF